MQWVKKRLLLLGIVLLLYGVYLVTHVPTAAPQKHVLGATTQLVLYTQPESKEDFLVSAIDSASKEVLVEVYLLSDKDVISSLENARERGVHVGVMLEQHPFGGGNLNPATAQDLKAHGVTVVWSNPTYSLTHEKAVIIDGQQAFILSQNLTTTSFSKNREYDVLDTNPTDVKELRDIFKADWDRTTYSPPENSNIVVSPSNSRAVLETLIKEANSSLFLEAEDIDDSEFVSLLSEKAQHIPVEIITPTLSQLSANKNALDTLKKAGVQVKVISSPYMHAKLILADNKKAYVGSVNFSTQSMDHNREVGIIVGESDIVGKIVSTFQNDWEKARSL